MKQISFLTQADLVDALQIERASHAFPWSEALLYGNQGENYFNFKLTVDQRLVGFVVCQTVMDEANLFNIVVAPAAQRCGYGRALLQHLIDFLSTKPITCLWLEVRTSNQAAIDLYESLGFNPVTVRHAYYPALKGREDALVMALDLQL